MSHLLTISDAIATHARLTPHKLGARDSRRTLSFAEWNLRATRLGAGLLNLGLGKGDRIGVVAYNCVEWMEIYVALARAGLVAVPINFRLTAPEIAYILEHAEVSALIVGADFCDTLETIRAALPIAPTRYVVMAQSLIKGWITYENVIANGNPHHSFEPVGPDEMCALMYT